MSIIKNLDAKFLKLIYSALYTQYSNIPLFHHSMRLKKKMAIRNTIFLIGCSNSKTESYV